MIVKSSKTYSPSLSSGMNSIQILGRVGQDPITRGENENFVTFSVATSKTYAKKNMTGDTGLYSFYTMYSPIRNH